MTTKTAKADVTRTKTSGVYRIWLSQEHFYIGRSSDIEGRCSGHLRGLRKGKHPNPFMQATFGWSDDFRLAMMQTRGTPEYRQKLSDSQRGKTISQETREKISVAGKGRPKSDETRKKLSQALRGMKKSPEWLARLSASHRGRKATEETKAKMSASQSLRQERERSLRLSMEGRVHG